MRKLFDFAFFPDFDSRLAELKELAMPENWEYRFSTIERKFPILYNYLHYTFERLQYEDKIAIEGDYACFNTGLVTKNQEDIFALFQENKKQDAKQDWFFIKFCKYSDPSLRVITTLPDTAHYFDDPSELLYDARLELRTNVDHIIQDNRDRFPAPLNEEKYHHQLRITLHGAITDAINRNKRNYKTAIPQFYQNRIQLLLPLYLTSYDSPDLALAVYKHDGKFYMATTCLTLDMAYNNARLIARPDMEWLIP